MPSSGIIGPHTSSVSFVAPNLPANQTSIQAGAKPGKNQARVITLTKTVKYYTHCKRDYHTEAECHDKYPHLRDSKPKSTKPQTKRRQEDKKLDQTDTKGSFFVQSDRAVSMSQFSTKLLLPVAPTIET